MRNAARRRSVGQHKTSETQQQQQQQQRYDLGVANDYGIVADMDNRHIVSRVATNDVNMLQLQQPPIEHLLE